MQVEPVEDRLHAGVDLLPGRVRQHLPLVADHGLGGADAVGLAANPVKIYEYLSLGKPVITTPVADTESFGDLLSVARTAAEMAEQLQAAVGASGLAAERRIAFARGNSWEVRAREYAEFVAALFHSGAGSDRC